MAEICGESPDGAGSATTGSGRRWQEKREEKTERKRSGEDLPVSLNLRPAACWVAGDLGSRRVGGRSSSSPEDQRS